MSSLPREVGFGALGTGLAALLASSSAPEPAAGLLWGGLVVGVGAAALAWRASVFTQREADRVAAGVAAVEAVGGGRAPDQLPPGWDALGAALGQLSASHATSLREREQALGRFRSVLDQSALGLVLVDTEGCISYANPAVRRMFRLRGSPVGRRPIEVVPAVEVHEVVTDVERSDAPVERSFATGWGDLAVRAERLDDGTIVVRLEDTTAARGAERARADFVANVSHELRTPITALMGYAETLLADADALPPATARLLATVERNARRLRDLFEDLLRLHRIETRLKQLPMESFLVEPVLVDAVIDAVDEAGARGIDFALEVDDGLRVTANRDALGAIVSNLARNAVAYTGDGGWVRVEATADGARRVIRVSDNGIGIARGHHQRIFERFYRVDEARSRRAGGTGLGLAIVKHYALAMGCEVSLESEAGQGSTFTVTLPPVR